MFLFFRPQDLPESMAQSASLKSTNVIKLENYESYKYIRNNVTSSLRKSKKEYFKSLADKLKSASLATSDYWKTLKSFIKPSVNTSIPPICHNGSYISDSSDKAKLLNDFFVSQTS